MILLENKIAIFNKIVFLKQKEECEKRIREEKEKAKKILAEKIESLKNDEEAFVDRRVTLAKRRGYELIASVEEKKRVLFLEEDEKLLNELLDTLSQKLLAFTKTDEYVDLEIENFKDILDEIDEKSIYLYVKKDENEKLIEKFKEIAKEKGVELNIDELYEYHIGGFIISDLKRTYNINLSLKNKLEDMRYEIGSMLHEKLKERGEVIGKGNN
ncbi:V-type proton ATPase subunit E [Peptoniphilus tyrrelliae]|nr:V-type proton ATPase subunit E [Peptoniphilus tyrrelliae]